MKALFKYILYSTFFAMSLPLVTACDDDEATDPYDINYVYIPVGGIKIIDKFI